MREHRPRRRRRDVGRQRAALRRHHRHCAAVAHEFRFTHVPPALSTPNPVVVATAVVIIIPRVDTDTRRSASAVAVRPSFVYGVFMCFVLTRAFDVRLALDFRLYFLFFNLTTCDYITCR